jgi:YggT family protein
MQSIVTLISELLNIYSWILLAAVILSWLISFNVINTRNQYVYQIGSMLNAATEPVLRPIRRLLPPMGGLDISPLIAYFGILFLRSLMCEYFGPCGFRF